MTANDLSGDGPRLAVVQEHDERSVVIDVEPCTIPVIRAEPVPIKVKVGSLRNGGWVTSIQRRWKPGEAALCHRCPRGTCCVDADNECSYQVKGFVDPALAWDHSPAKAAGFTWAEGQGGGERVGPVGVLGTG